MMMLKSKTTGERFAAQIMPTGSWLISAPLTEEQATDLREAIETGADYTIDGETTDARPADLEVVHG